MPLAFLESATVDMSTITGGITSIVTAAISWCTSFVTEIMGQPLLLFFTLLSASLFGIHILKSLMGR